MTTRLEQKKRIIADHLMAETPGLPRQEAKRQAEPNARLAVALDDIRDGCARMAKVFRNVARACYVNTPERAERFRGRV